MWLVECNAAKFYSTEGWLSRNGTFPILMNLGYLSSFKRSTLYTFYCDSGMYFVDGLLILLLEEQGDKLSTLYFLYFWEIILWAREFYLYLTDVCERKSYIQLLWKRRKSKVPWLCWTCSIKFYNKMREVVSKLRWCVLPLFDLYKILDWLFYLYF